MDDALGSLQRDLGESSDSAPPNSSSPTSAANTADDPEADSLQQLQQQASSDRPYVTAHLADSWVPQLSPKRSTQPWTRDPENGVEYDSARTLQEHRQLRQKYPDVKLLWSGDWSTFSPSQTFWVTVAGITFDDSSGALAWCRSQGLDADHCTATKIN
jgi:hypothetical protein